MGNIYSDKQREQISIMALNKLLMVSSKGRIQSYISDNDKEPMWDGHIYIYKESGSEKRDDFLFRIPVQVKSKEVKRFDNKFLSYPIDTVCLKSYFNDNGIIYFVVEIKVDDYGREETKVFYKILLPSDIKKILDNTSENQISKNVHLNRILTIKSNFYDVCFQFNELRKIQSIELINNPMPLEKVQDKEIEIIMPNGFNDLLSGDFYSYCLLDDNMKIPVEFPYKFIECTISLKNTIDFNNKSFTNCKKHITNTGEVYFTFGDGIVFKKDKKLTIKSSEDNVDERLKTLEYILTILINKEKISYPQNEMRLISQLEEEKHLLEDIINVCSRFNINTNMVRLRDFNEGDFKVLNLLLNVKMKGTMTGGQIECLIVDFLKYKISLYKVTYKDSVVFYDFYSNEINLCIVGEYEDKKVEFSRFALVDERFFICENSNIKLIRDSIVPFKEGYEEILSNYYNKLILALIKAWDISHNKKIIDLIEYLMELIKGHVGYDIETINKLQIKYRANNGLSHKDKEELYRIKFKEEISNDKVCAICILLEDYEGFEERFEKLLKEEQENFKKYPIYTLYKKNIINEA